MSDLENAIVDNAGTDEGTPETDLTSEIEADLASFEENDPGRQLARKVAKDLEELDPEGEATGQAKPPEAKKEEFEAEKSKLAQALRKRNEVHQEREKARAEAEQIKADALRMKAQAEAFAQQVREQAQWLHELKANPLKALEAAGINPEDFIFDLAKDGTPEGAQAKELRELRAKQSQYEQWMKKQEEERQNHLKQQQQAQAQQFRQQVETQFLGAATAKENIKLALESGLVSKRVLVDEGDRIADQYRELTGQEASLEEIIEYIDEQVSKAYTRIRGTSQASKVPAMTPALQSKPPVRKTLTQDDASERRSLRPEINPDESDDERRARAAKAVGIVMAKARARGDEE